jgi:inhibitor of KinA sporulation pathway (predicted exonuclease)
MYLIIDLEATCWRQDEGHWGESEIIEIGAVVVGDDYKICGEFQRFVKPVRNPMLSDFCKELTSITQADVDAAQNFPQTLQALQAKTEEISGQPLVALVFCSWGDYDRNQLMKDCQYHHIAYPFGPHRNLKRAFAEKRRIKPIGLDRALEILGLPLEGTYHRGIDDARNIAKIFRHSCFS